MRALVLAVYLLQRSCFTGYFECSFICLIDDCIDQWHRRLHACIRATEGHFE